MLPILLGERKRVMKKIVFILLLSIVSASCNDDDVVPSEPKNAFVTRISYNGMTELELSYDIQKRLSRVNYFNGGVFQIYTLFEYDENGLREMRRYVAEDHTLFGRTVFTHDNLGRISKGANYSAPGFMDEIHSNTEFVYNTSGQLIARVLRPIGEPIFYRDDFTYDDKGNIITEQRTYDPTNEEESSGTRHEYIPGDKTIPDGWKDIVLILDTTGYSDYVRNIFNSNDHQTTWYEDKVIFSEWSIEYSDKVFDDDGNLTSMIATRKNIKKPENPNIVVPISYDYVEAD